VHLESQYGVFATPKSAQRGRLQFHTPYERGRVCLFLVSLSFIRARPSILIALHSKLYFCTDYQLKPLHLPFYADYTTALENVVCERRCGQRHSCFCRCSIRRDAETVVLSLTTTQQYPLYSVCSGLSSFNVTTVTCLSLYSPVVTIWTTSLTFNNSTFCPDNVFM